MKKYKKTLDNICYITYIDRTDESENFEIVFYKKRGGQCPIQEFLDSLDVKMRAKALLMVALLREHGANPNGGLTWTTLESISTNSFKIPNSQLNGTLLNLNTKSSKQ